MSPPTPPMAVATAPSEPGRSGRVTRIKNTASSSQKRRYRGVSFRCRDLRHWPGGRETATRAPSTASTSLWQAYRPCPASSRSAPSATRRPTWSRCWRRRTTCSTTPTSTRSRPVRRTTSPASTCRAAGRTGTTVAARTLEGWVEDGGPGARRRAVVHDLPAAVHRRRRRRARRRRGAGGARGRGRGRGRRAAARADDAQGLHRPAGADPGDAGEPVAGLGAVARPRAGRRCWPSRARRSAGWSTTPTAGRSSTSGSGSPTRTGSPPSATCWPPTTC